MAESKTHDPCYIDRITIYGLWGRRDISLTFFKDVSIIIGPNASGKTTILNLLRYVLTADTVRLSEITFDRIVVVLKTFEGRGRKQIKVEPSKQGFTFTVSNQVFELDVDDRAKYLQARHGRAVLFAKNRDLVDMLSQLAPAVWLPVSRRLPIPEEEEEDFRPRRRSHLESVDARLRDLLDELAHYRLGLEAQLADKYKQFEKRVLQSILYSKQHDRVSSFRFEGFSGDEKSQLLRAFEAAGFLDSHIRRQIDEHFDEAEKAIERLAEFQQRKQTFTLDDVFIVPLIGRTKQLTQFARQLEDERETLFAPLNRYEATVNTFLENKSIKVLDKGNLKITPTINGQDFSPFHLSSGEKQILILLSQALLSERTPVIYVADEPELSLHVTWQEKLLSSLRELGQQMQLIVATHSPDIVGPFVMNVIDLGKHD